MQKTILTILYFFSFWSTLLAYPISPRPLRQLVIESQYIVKGYVVKTYAKETKKEKDSWGTWKAKVAVLEVLNGNLKKDTIEIEFNPYMICPAPAEYFDSTQVLAFLYKDKKTGNYYTHALSYGAKTLSTEAMEIHKQRILEMLKILKLSDETQRTTETVEWLVKCTENETTRWDGTFELSPASNFMSHYSREPKQDYKSILNPLQKERLKTALLASSYYVDFGLVDLVYENNETSIDDFLLRKLKNLKEEHYWLADEFMKRLKHKNNSAEMKQVLEEFNKVRFEPKKEEELKKIIEKFIRLVE